MGVCRNSAVLLMVTTALAVSTADAKPARPVKTAAPEVNDGASKVGVIDTFPASTPDGLVREAFKCALDYPDDAAGFACYSALNVEINRDTVTALQHLRLYQWTYFRKRAASYVVKTEPFSLQVTRRDPRRVTGSSRYAKVFFKSRQRDNPAPIVLRRDAGVWQVYQNSL
jgi:hypothetical protein